MRSTRGRRTVATAANASYWRGNDKLFLFVRHTSEPATMLVGCWVLKQVPRGHNQGFARVAEARTASLNSSARTAEALVTYTHFVGFEFLLSASPTWRSEPLMVTLSKGPRRGHAQATCIRVGETRTPICIALVAALFCTPTAAPKQPPAPF